MITIVILIAVASAGLLLFSPRLARAPLWRATVTPLASIIGSGFLVLGPILHISFGWYAPAAMAALCLVAWAFGAAIRFNIGRREAGVRSRAEERLELVASWALAFAYFISVAYYLNLFGAFGTELTPWQSPEHGTDPDQRYAAPDPHRRLEPGVQGAGMAGNDQRFAEAGDDRRPAERDSPWYFGDKAMAGELIVSAPKVTGWQALAVAFGLDRHGPGLRNVALSRRRI